VFLSLYFLIPSIPFIDSSYDAIKEYVIELLGVKIGNNDRRIMMNTINAGTNFIGLFISVSLTIYFFTYRQRRTLSISSTNIAMKSKVIPYFIILICILYGKTLFIEIDQTNALIVLSNKQYIKISIFAVLRSEERRVGKECSMLCGC